MERIQEEFIKNSRHFALLVHNNLFRPLITTGCVFLCWIQWYFWKFSKQKKHKQKYHGALLPVLYDCISFGKSYGINSFLLLSLIISNKMWIEICSYLLAHKYNNNTIYLVFNFNFCAYAWDTKCLLFTSFPYLSVFLHLLLGNLKFYNLR